MQLTIALREDFSITKKGPYWICAYCNKSVLGSQALLEHFLTVTICNIQFVQELKAKPYIPPTPKRKWWQKFRKQKSPFVPTLKLPGINQ